MIRPSAAEDGRSDEPYRSRLLVEAAAFVRGAAGLRGVTRVALIGSLTTTKSHPKDLDLLVTVSDDADLTALASLSRRTAGHLQSLNSWADVFLANPAGTYVGRVCPWRECAPGIRRSCDALNCGRRPYLHDDLRAVTLPDSLVAAPPLEIWPEVVARVHLPPDLRRLVDAGFGL